MLSMMSGTSTIIAFRPPSALPCSLCGIGTLPCSLLLHVPCSCLCSSMTLLGWHTTSCKFECACALDDAPDHAPTSSSSALAAGYVYPSI